MLGGLAKASLEACDFDRSVELGHRLLEQGETEDDRRLVVEGRYVLGATAFWRGELAASAEHLGQAIARYRPDDHPAYVALFGQDPRVVCLIRLALTLWYLGRPSDAGRPMEEALAVAETLGHPLSLAYALEFGTWLSCD
ncbi:MAG: tetratricopeptide repeat protein, partial [Anaerolineales bacterium]